MNTGIRFERGVPFVAFAPLRTARVAVSASSHPPADTRGRARAPSRVTGARARPVRRGTRLDLPGALVVRVVEPDRTHGGRPVSAAPASG